MNRCHTFKPQSGYRLTVTQLVRLRWLCGKSNSPAGR